MRTVVRVDAESVTPSLDTVLRSQGITDPARADERVRELGRQALAVFSVLGKPSAVLAEVAPDDFRSIYSGEGKNAQRGPVDLISPQVTRMALYAATIGEAICEEISRLFDANDFALAAMLDGAASEGTERFAARVEDRYRAHLQTDGQWLPGHATMRFSPGYCGWHLTGQLKLFAFLRPGDAGIQLLDSCLMRPLKSISGAIFAGARESFDFECDFSFCEECTTYSCRERLAELN